MIMQGATYEEFAAMLKESWEIEYTHKGHEYFYQRSGHNGTFDVQLLCDGKVICHETGEDMGAIAARLLALNIYDGKNAREAEQDIKVQFEA